MQAYERAATYAHSPYVNLSMKSNTTPVTSTVLEKTPWDNPKTNDFGCWNPALQLIVCPKAGRVSVGVTFIASLPAAIGSTLITMAYDVRIENSAGTVYNARRLAQGFGKGGFSAIGGATIIDVNFGDRVYGLHYIETAGCTIVGSDLASSGFEWDFSSLTFSYLH